MVLKNICLSKNQQLENSIFILNKFKLKSKTPFPVILLSYYNFFRIIFELLGVTYCEISQFRIMKNSKKPFNKIPNFSSTAIMYTLYRSN